MPRSCHGVRLSTLVLTAQVVSFYTAENQTDRQTDKVTEEAKTRSSAIAEGPRDASCQLKSCQLPCKSAETLVRQVLNKSKL